MKKLLSTTFGFIAAMTMAMSFCLAGCVNLFSFNGKFSKDEIVLDIGQEFLPKDYFSSEKAVEFFAEDESVVKKSETGAFTALKSGKTSLVAKSGDLLIDSVQVYVKYSFQKPTNITVSNDGLISWDSCTFVLNGKTLRPTYKVSLNGIERDTPTNQFQIEQAGSYTIAVRTNATTLVNASVYSDEISFVYDSVAGASGITFTSEDVFGSQSGTLTWVGEGDATLAIGNIEQGVTGNEKILNLSSYAENSAIDAQLKLSDGSNESKTSTKRITKLFTQEPAIRNNEVYWLASNSVKHTLIRAVNVVTGATEVVTALSNTSVLNGLGEGIYTISNQAIGMEGYANGNIKDFSYQVGKVKNIDAECQLDGTTLKVTFTTQSEYNKKFVVKQNSEVYNFEFAGEKVDGKYTLTHNFALSTGMNVFTIQAIPTLNDGEFEYGGRATKLAIKSDEEKIFSAYNIATIDEIAHSTDEDENSVLTFDNIEYANSYQVKINGILDTEISQIIGQEKTEIKLGKITKEKYGDTQQFVVEITATRVAAPNEIVSPSVAYKSLTMLSKPSMANCNGAQNANNSNRYSWQQDANATYTYQLYLTNETFETTAIEPFVEDVASPSTKTLTAGYYVVKVRSLPIDENNYLASEEWGEDTFYYTESIACPRIRLDYVSGLSSEYSGYVLKIKTVEFGYQYKVLFGEDETDLGSVYNTNFELEELTFNLPATAVLTDTKNIKIVAIAENAALQTIHSNGTSQLTVEKLATPSQYSIIENNGKIKVQNTDDSAVMKLYKNGVMIAESAAGSDVEADISTYDGEFTIQAQCVGYDEFDEYTTQGTTKISSDFASFVLHRSQTPSNLVYNAGVVSFEHSDTAEKYVVTIVVGSNNGTKQKTFDATVTEDGNKRSFNLEDEIASLREADAEFDAIFTQKTDIVLSLCGYISEEIGEVYYLPSFNATAKYDSTKNQIVISKLDQVALEYDYDRKVIFWDGDESLDPVYDIYLNNACVATVTTKSASDKYEYDISGYDFSVAGEYGFYVIASSDNTLASDESKNIVIRKISQVQKLDVIEKTDGYYAKFTFAAGDEGHIDDVIINSTSNGANSEFKLNADAFEIVIKGENYVDANGDKIYYISSEKSTFTIAQLQLNAFDAQSSISSSTISWEDYAAANANSWSLTTPDKNLKYMIEIYDGETLKTTISNIATTSLVLTNQKLLNLASGSYAFKLYAYIGEYEIANGGSGYYGKILLEENVSIKKLAAISSLEITIDDEEASIAEELAKDIVLSWEHNDTGSSDVSFEIYINGLLKTTTAAKTYTFSQADFGEEENTISVVAISSTDIHSDKVETKLFRYSQPEITIDDRGILKITDNDVPAVASGYIIEVTMSSASGESQTNEYYTTSREYDLNAVNAGINERAGGISVRVIQRVCHSATNAIPTMAAETTKVVLAAPTISQTDSGFVISSTDNGVTYYVKCEDKNYDEQVTGSIFTYPDEWESGTYNLVIYAKRTNAIDSWKNKPTSVIISRVAAASEAVFELAENYLDYNISWDAITDADAYQIEIYKDGNKIGNTLDVSTASVKVSELRTAATDFKSGEYTISLRTLADYSSTSKTNSVPFKFKVTVAENTVNSTEINEDGKFSFKSNNKENFFIVTRQTDATEWFGEQVEAVTTEYIVPKYAGQLEISVVQINNSTAQQTATAAQGVVINGAPVVANATKLQDIVSVVKDQSTGKITLNVSVEATDAERKFRVIHDNIEKDLEVVKNGNSYEFLAIDMVNLFGDLVDGDFEFEIISLIEGYVRSNGYETKIGYSNHNNSSTPVKQDEANDYLILTGDLVDGTTTVDGSSVSALISAVHITTTNRAKINYYCQTPVLGYWIVDNNIGVEVPKYFSATNVTGTNITSTRCCAINISTLLDNYDAGDILVQIGFISMQGDLFTVVNYSEIYTYKKLSVVSTFEIHEGNFTWTNTSEGNTAYMLYFEGDTTKKEIKVSASGATYYLGENVDMSEQFTAGIKVVSSTLQTVPSKITNYMADGAVVKISQLAKVQSEMSVNNGVMWLEFNTAVDATSPESSTGETNEEKYPSIEAMLAALDNNGAGGSSSFPSVTSFCQQLISNRMTQPFRFKLKDLENVEFNLKFVKTLADGTKKIYYTSVKAINILTQLNSETLASIKDRFSDESITEEEVETRRNLDKVYKMLTNMDYFTGVASSNLLFREIGEGETGEFNLYPATKIPAGEYDIYIQQIGSAQDGTISSQYKLAKTNIKVEKSPMTRVDSEQINGGESNVYYAKFNPIEGKTTYKLALRDKVSSEVIEYTITKQGDKYYRSAFDGEPIELRYEGGFVWIPMSGTNGVIYDTGVKDIHGYDLVLKEIKQKHTSGNVANYTVIPNGTKIGGADGNITIAGTTYTYQIENGVVSFTNSAITVTAGEVTVGNIVYSVFPVGLVGNDFSADIYAVGDDTTLNGLSEEITVTFLKFNIDTLELKDGKFVWDNFTVNSKTYSSTVITQRTNTTTTVETEIKPISGVKASFTPTEQGSYQKFKFFTKGEAAGFEIKVDSDIYIIENLYKLNRPGLQTVNGMLIISDNTASQDTRTEKNFILSNDVSEEKDESKEQAYVVGAKKNSGTFSNEWQTGLNGMTESEDAELYKYHLTEQTATKFYAAVSGESFGNSSFAVTGTNIGTSEGYYTVVVIGKDTPILLQSEKSSVDAAKLAYSGISIEEGEITIGETAESEGEIKIINGDIVWTPSIQSIAEDTIANSETRKNGDLEILYEVEVGFYYETSSYWNKHSSTVYYTNANQLPNEKIVDPVSGETFKYTFKVCANVYAYTSDPSSADITTVEGVSYKKITNKKYSAADDGVEKYILCGEILTLGTYEESGENLIARTSRIKDFAIGGYDSDASDNTNAGKLQWKYESTSEQQTVVFEVYAITGGARTQLVGKFSKQASSNSYVFDIEPGQLSVDKSYNFEVIAYEVDMSSETTQSSSEESATVKKYFGSEVASNGVKLFANEMVKLLPNVKSSDYEVESEGSENKISFSEYFKSHQDEYGSDIRIRVYDDDKDDDKYGYISSTGAYGTGHYEEGKEKEVRVRAIPVKANGKYLMSDSDFAITLAGTTWSEYDGYYYDPVSQTLYWTFGVTECYALNGSNSENFVGVEIYLKTSKDDQDTYYPFGVYQSQSIADKDLIKSDDSADVYTFQEKTNVDFYDGNGSKVDGAWVYLNQIKIESGKAVAASEQNVNVYVGEGDEVGQFESGREYQLSQKAFAVNAFNPYLNKEAKYYLPISALDLKVETDSTTAETRRTVSAAAGSVYYTDVQCTQKFLIEKVLFSETEAEGADTAFAGYEGGLQDWNANATYQKVYLFQKDENNTISKESTYYLKTTDVLRELAQEEKRSDYIDGVTFKVSFTTEYNYEENNAKYEVKESREYRNVPIGEIVKGSFNGAQIGEDGIRVTSFQFPRMGTVSNVEICVRKTENNLLSGPLSEIKVTGADGKVTTNSKLADETFAINLFNFGEGTSADPYIIANENQFKNMNYRSEKPAYLLNYSSVKKITKRSGKNWQTITNSTLEKDVKETETNYYFKQNKDIALTANGFLIDETFHGVYDGDGKSVTVNVATVKALSKDEYVTTALPVSTGYDNGQEFTNGAGIFKCVGENGTIKNINLSFLMTVNSTLAQSIATGKTLIGGLVFRNTGVVDSVTVVASSVTFGSALQQSSALAVAPVIGENKGNATNLVSTADVTIKNDKQSSGSQHFYYGGIVGFHNSGTLLFAKSKNNSNQTSTGISVTFTSNTNGTVAVGGVAIAARSIIDIALNTKNISATSNGGSAFAGGVVCLAVGTKLHSCVNTADVSAAYAGGIAYAFYNTSVSTLVGLGTVNNSVQNLFAKTMSFASSSTSETVYSYSTYKPSGSFRLMTLSENKTINCKNRPTYRIQVTVASGVYTADIVNTKQ